MIVISLMFLALILTTTYSSTLKLDLLLSTIVSSRFSFITYFSESESTFFNTETFSPLARHTFAFVLK